MNKYAAAAILILLVATAAGGAAGYHWWIKKYGPQPEVVTATPAVQQPDGSVVVERKPNRKPAKAPHAIPRKAIEERRVSVTVQPTDKDCPPVTTNLSIVRQGDGRRVIASSPDGQVLEAIDIPIEPVLMVKPKKPWAAGISYSLADETAGLWLERDIGKLVIGADLYGLSDDRGVDARIRIGMRF